MPSRGDMVPIDGSKLRSLREREGLTVEELATSTAETGQFRKGTSFTSVSASTIGLCERGISNTITKSRLRCLAEVLQCKPQELQPDNCDDADIVVADGPPETAASAGEIRKFIDRFGVLPPHPSLVVGRESDLRELERRIHKSPTDGTSNVLIFAEKRLIPIQYRTGDVSHLMRQCAL